MPSQKWTESLIKLVEIETKFQKWRIKFPDISLKEIHTVSIDIVDKLLDLVKDGLSRESVLETELIQTKEKLAQAEQKMTALKKILD